MADKVVFQHTAWSNTDTNRVVDDVSPAAESVPSSRRSSNEVSIRDFLKVSKISMAMMQKQLYETAHRGSVNAGAMAVISGGRSQAHSTASNWTQKKLGQDTHEEADHPGWERTLTTVAATAIRANQILMTEKRDNFGSKKNTVDTLGGKKLEKQTTQVENCNSSSSYRYRKSRRHRMDGWSQAHSTASAINSTGVNSALDGGIGPLAILNHKLCHDEL